MKTTLSFFAGLLISLLVAFLIETRYHSPLFSSLGSPQHGPSLSSPTAAGPRTPEEWSAQEKNQLLSLLKQIDARKSEIGSLTLEGEKLQRETQTAQLTLKTSNLSASNPADKTAPDQADDLNKAKTLFEGIDMLGRKMAPYLKKLVASRKLDLTKGGQALMSDPDFMAMFSQIMEGAGILMKKFNIKMEDLGPYFDLTPELPLAVLDGLQIHLTEGQKGQIRQLYTNFRNQLPALGTTPDFSKLLSDNRFDDFVQSAYQKEHTELTLDNQLGNLLNITLSPNQKEQVGKVMGGPDTGPGFMNDPLINQSNQVSLSPEAFSNSTQATTAIQTKTLDYWAQTLNLQDNQKQTITPTIQTFSEKLYALEQKVQTVQKDATLSDFERKRQVFQIEQDILSLHQSTESSILRALPLSADQSKRLSISTGGPAPIFRINIQK